MVHEVGQLADEVAALLPFMTGEEYGATRICHEGET